MDPLAHAYLKSLLETPSPSGFEQDFDRTIAKGLEQGIEVGLHRGRAFVAIADAQATAKVDMLERRPERLQRIDQLQGAL